MLKSTNVLKIEDILPLFPEFSNIDNFRDEICQALDEYDRTIRSLNEQLDEATRNSENIRMDIRDLRKR